MKKGIANKLEEIKKKIEHFERMSFQNFQSFKWFKSLVTGKQIYFNNGVLSTKVSETSDMVMFNVVIPPNTKFPEHWHDCKEVIEVVRGKLYDDDIKVVAKKGDIVTIPKFVPHQPYTKGDEATILMIEFKNKEDEN